MEKEEMMVTASKLAARAGFGIRVDEAGLFSVFDIEASKSFIKEASISEVVAFLAGACISKGFDPREVV